MILQFCNCHHCPRVRASGRHIADTGQLFTDRNFKGDNMSWWSNCYNFCSYLNYYCKEYFKVRKSQPDFLLVLFAEQLLSNIKFFYTIIRFENKT